MLQISDMNYVSLPKSQMNFSNYCNSKTPDRSPQYLSFGLHFIFKVIKMCNNQSEESEYFMLIKF